MRPGQTSCHAPKHGGPVEFTKFGVSNDENVRDVEGIEEGSMQVTTSFRHDSQVLRSCFPHTFSFTTTRSEASDHPTSSFPSCDEQ